MDALVALVQREVRSAVAIELSTAFANLHQRSSFASNLSRSEADVAFPDMVPSSVGSLTTQALPSTDFGRPYEAVLESEQAAPSTTASSRCGELPFESPGAPPLKQKMQDAVSILDVLEIARSAEALARSTDAQFKEQSRKLEDQQRELKDLQEVVSRQNAILDRTWKEQAELRAEGDQDVEERLRGHIEARLEAMDSQLAQVSASVGSLARLQVELGSEAKVRQEADGRLQAFLREFRGHIVGEIEEMRAKYEAVSGNVESVRVLVGRVVELVEMRNSFSACVSARVAGPDELEGSTPHQDGAVSDDTSCTPEVAVSLFDVGPLPALPCVLPLDAIVLEPLPAVVIATT